VLSRHRATYILTSPPCQAPRTLAPPLPHSLLPALPRTSCSMPRMNPDMAAAASCFAACFCSCNLCWEHECGSARCLLRGGQLGREGGGDMGGPSSVWQAAQAAARWAQPRALKNKGRPPPMPRAWLVRASWFPHRRHVLSRLGSHPQTPTTDWHVCAHCLDPALRPDLSTEWRSM